MLWRAACLEISATKVCLILHLSADIYDSSVSRTVLSIAQSAGILNVYAYVLRVLKIAGSMM